MTHHPSKITLSPQTDFAALPATDKARSSPAGAPLDETTLVVFRGRLLESGDASTLFEAVLASLRRGGLVLKEGTIVEATIVEAPQGSKRADGFWTRERWATYTKNHGTLRHGYKAHLATDRRGIITDYVFGTAKAHDRRHADHLLRHERRAAGVPRRPKPGPARAPRPGTNADPSIVMAPCDTRGCSEGPNVE